ncbi:DMT family transporter [Prosthecomicrobium sp. N25]|uniref:DMT family transporter n=1 Tax=Prosthecomicrobium sp. N25 TaxID=3129254 RepID=UPI003077207D
MSRSPLIGSAMALAAGLLWSFGVLTVRFAAEADPFQYLIWRAVGVMAVMEGISVVSGGGLLLPRFLKTDRLGFVAAAGLVLAAVAFVFALKRTTVANAVFFASTAPLQTAILARIFLGERLGTGGVASILVGLAGLLVMVGGDLGGGDLAGNLGGLFSAFGFAVYAVAVRLGKGRDFAPVLAGYGLLTLLVCLAATLFNGRTLLPPPLDVAMAVTHGAALIGIGTILFNRASRAVPAVGLTVLAQTETVFAPLWVYLVFAETPKATSLAGGALILAAILLKAFTTPPEPRPALGERPA